MLLRILFILFGVFSLINGLWMLLAPESWYNDLPAGVPDTGPYNGHFIRDLGLVFVLIAAGFFWSAARLINPNLILLGLHIFCGHAFCMYWI